MIGKSLNELIKRDKFAGQIAKLEQIRQEVICQEKMITYVNFLPYNDSIAMLLCYHIPMFAPDGSVIATAAMSEQASIFNHSLKVNQQFRAENAAYCDNIKLQNDEIKLTNREQEILYLLTIGFSQEDAARYLEISRGTLIKTISSRICPQFGIEGSNTKLLISKVIKLKYFDHIPKTLLQPKVMIIEDDFNI